MLIGGQDIYKMCTLLKTLISLFSLDSKFFKSIAPQLKTDTKAFLLNCNMIYAFSCDYLKW